MAKKRRYNIDDFYNNFNEKSSINRDKSLYKKIVKTFLSVYFKEVLYSHKPIYFLFGGMIKKIKVGDFFGRKSNEDESLQYFNLALGFEWFNRPCPTMEAQVRFRKLNGSTSSLSSLINKWKETNDISNYEKRSQWQD